MTVIGPASLDSQGYSPDERIAAALERIATALEQSVLERIDHAPNATAADPYPTELPFPTDEVVDLPPVRPAGVNPIPPDGCPIHHTPWKVVPAGTSKRTGNPYQAFRACSTPGCDQRPRL